MIRSGKSRLGLLGRSVIPLLASCAVMSVTNVAVGNPPATDQRELQGRKGNVVRRMCVGGNDNGNLCNENGACDSLQCVDRNVFNITVAVHFGANCTQRDNIKKAVSALSTVLFDATDGQAEIGKASIKNNASGAWGDLHIYDEQEPRWWSADTGQWARRGSVSVDILYLERALVEICCGMDGPVGEYLAHEFMHLTFDVMDEYEARESNCGPVIYCDDIFSVCVNGDIAGTTCTDDVDCSDQSFCPHTTTTEDCTVDDDRCLMDLGGVGSFDGVYSELCWGQGDPNNLCDCDTCNCGVDPSCIGNHDAYNQTEQSVCRKGRSCRAQVEWSWTDVFLLQGPPILGVGGGEVNDTEFIDLEATARGVLVLDESGSMGFFENPPRIEKLKLAAKNFVTLAETGTELGIVSYSNAAPGNVNLPIAPLPLLDVDRLAWRDAINLLSPGGGGNIGAGLNAAKNMIDDAGGVTANTFIVLMTDGINFRPGGDAAADLQEKLDILLAAGIPVYVTCTGGDLGLAPQCSEIAAGTQGYYVDSADAANLPEAFVDFNENIAEREHITSASGMLSGTDNIPVFVEGGTESLTFTLVWEEALADGEMTVGFECDPLCNEIVFTQEMAQGRYVRISDPKAGEWQMTVTTQGGPDSAYVARAYSRHQTRSLSTVVRFASVFPGDEINVYAFPRSVGGSITHPTDTIEVTVLLPDDMPNAIIHLDDKGRIGPGGDDVPGDGIFSGLYKTSNLKGAYTFLPQVDMDGWAHNPHGNEPKIPPPSPRFVREVRLSAAVGVPGDVEKDPEDNQVDTDGDGFSDLDDNCPAVFNPDQCDLDGDGVGVVCDLCPGCDDNDDDNRNGIPNGCDPVCATPTLCDGDANGDGAVDPLDSGALLARFGLDPCDDDLCQYDVNCDGAIDPLDSGYVLARFGTCGVVKDCKICPAPGCGPGACGPGAGDCCIANGTVGCDQVACCEAICCADPFCCDTEWDQICADAATALPSCDCDGGPGNLFNDNCEDAPVDTLNIGDTLTYEATNEGATLTCEALGALGETWHAFDLTADADVTTSKCGTVPVWGNAFIVVDPECPCSGVFIFATAFDQVTCADGNWSVHYNGLPAGDYWAPEIFDPALGNEGKYIFNISAAEPLPPDPCGPGNGDCCLEGGNGTPGCDDEACCAAVCAIDSFCCDTEWDTQCAVFAADLCDICQSVCGPGNGDCCLEGGNGTPGCDDEACCEAICAADPFCCDTEWDQICVDAAIASPSCDCAGGPGNLFNDNCEDAPVDSLSVGETLSYDATLEGATLTCEALGALGETWHAFDLSADADVTASHCGTDPVFGNAFIVIDPECPCSGAFIFATGFDQGTCADGNWTIHYDALPAGDYWSPVMYDPGFGNEGKYVWNISADP